MRPRPTGSRPCTGNSSADHHESWPHALGNRRHQPPASTGEPDHDHLSRPVYVLCLCLLHLAGARGHGFALFDVVEREHLAVWIPRVGSLFPGPRAALAGTSLSRRRTQRRRFPTMCTCTTATSTISIRSAPPCCPFRSSRRRTCWAFAPRSPQRAIQVHADRAGPVGENGALPPVEPARVPR